MPRIFISYRRADSIAETGRIHDRLEREFGDENVFKDVDDIPLGVDFRLVLAQEVGACDVLLVVIGKSWAAIAHPDGRKRLFDVVDFVRIEVEAGLNRKDIMVIPTLVGGAQMPAGDELPESLQPLIFLNAATIRHDPDFRRDMDRMVSALKKYFNSMGIIGDTLIQLDSLEDDVSWAEIDTLLTQGLEIAGESITLTQKIEGRRDHLLAERWEQVEKLLGRADSLSTADPIDVEAIESTLNQAESLVPSLDDVSDRIDIINWRVSTWQAEQESKRLAKLEFERQTTITNLLNSAESALNESDIDSAKQFLIQANEHITDDDEQFYNQSKLLYSQIGDILTEQEAERQRQIIEWLDNAENALYNAEVDIAQRFLQQADKHITPEDSEFITRANTLQQLIEETASELEAQRREKSDEDERRTTITNLLIRAESAIERSNLDEANNLLNYADERITPNDKNHKKRIEFLKETIEDIFAEQEDQRRSEEAEMQRRLRINSMFQSVDLNINDGKLDKANQILAHVYERILPDDDEFIKHANSLSYRIKTINEQEVENQAKIESKRQQKIANLLAQAEGFLKNKHPNIPYIEKLLDELDELVLGSDATVLRRVSAIEVEVEKRRVQKITPKQTQASVKAKKQTGTKSIAPTKQKRKLARFLMFVALLVFLFGFNLLSSMRDDKDDPVEQAVLLTIEATPVPTLVIKSTDTPQPTDTPVPIDLPTSTNIPLPTASDTSTPTDLPTNTNISRPQWGHRKIK